jgi:hypothetical protein
MGDLALCFLLKRSDGHRSNADGSVQPVVVSERTLLFL